jgi:hypothetical protein
MSYSVVVTLRRVDDSTRWALRIPHDGMSVEPTVTTMRYVQSTLHTHTHRAVGQ